ncbi:filamentous hemagglutinin N-terminal domain-containing protein [Fulvimonas yonginensis]|uniref:Filamentous hemagglutinin N-terminal domain-containing protein n=1 Tax=Fulvimonas yonginensis TaxID=1495200 RepID=A0ABU8JDQ0_9GAMM
MNRMSGWTAAALAAAILLALRPVPAHADIGTRQMPGQGRIVSGHVSAGVAGAGTQTITIGNASDPGLASAVIDWGSGTDINPTRTAGFNLGPQSRLTFNDGTGGHGAAVLNIDSTGNPSQIFGQLVGNGTSIFVANRNGIIVGAGARITSTANVALIGNTLIAGGSGFDGNTGSLAYDGSGGDVTVARGAVISGNSVLVAGGGNVNVDLGAFTGPSGSTTLAAGRASAGAGSGATDNPNASLTTAGALPTGRSLGGFSSAGTALNTGTLALSDGYSVAGLFTNQGNLTLPASNGSMWNQGNLSSDVGTTFTALTNDGTFTTSHGITVKGGGDLVNTGTINGAQLIEVVDGSVNNSGRIVGVVGLSTSSNRYYQPGAYYSIVNTGTITSYGQLTIDANRASHYNDGANTSTGSFINTGTLQLAKGAKLQVKGWQDVYLGGKVQTGFGANAQDVSTSNPIGELVSSAGGYNATVDTPTFWTDGVLTIATPLAVSGAIIHGRQVKILSNVLGVDANGAQAGNITIAAGSQMTGDYAVTIANGATVSGHMVSIKGPTYTVAPTDGRVTNPNVLLDGTLTAGWIYLGDSGQPLSDVFSGPGGFLKFTGTDPRLTIAFTGTVGALPSAGTDFRYAFLPVRSRRAPLLLSLKPVTYTSSAGSVNLLVDGSVNLVPPVYNSSPAIYGSGSAPSPSAIPNTHLVLQASGSITTGTGRFYWPGYVYLGTVAGQADGTPAPATLGTGTITLGGKFSNVLPGSTASDGGIEFITAQPLNLNGYTVTTNANSWISFGTQTLTDQYASGALGAGAFFGGKQSGSTVIYAALDPSMFHTDTPPAAQ